MLTDDLTEYFELQGSMAMLTKTDLLQFVRRHGGKLGDRNLLYYNSVGLMPHMVRVGSRHGAYPALAAEQALWLVRNRERGASIDALRELLPVWKLIVRCRRDEVVDLAEIEYVARGHVTLPEANALIPMLISDVINGRCRECQAAVSWRLKNGDVKSQADGSSFALSFVLGEIDETTGLGRQVAWTQLSFPGMSRPELDDPATIILGVPNNIAFGCDEYAPIDPPKLKQSRQVSRPRRSAVTKEEALFS